MESIGNRISTIDSAASVPDPASKGAGGAATDATRIAEVKTWLASQFEAAGRSVPAFDYTPRSVAHLHALASLSQSRSRAASIVAADLRLKASEYRAQAARIREILESIGLGREQLSPGAIGSAQVVAGVANLLNIRDTEMSSIMLAMGDLSLRKADVEEKKAKVQKESKVLLEYTRKAIAKLNDVKKMLVKYENEIGLHEAQMLQWQTNLAIIDSKERQYMLQLSNYKAILNRVGYTPEINHGVLMEMAEHKKDLEKKTKPILDTLRSYQDLPPDKTLAALAIEDKKGNMLLQRSIWKKCLILPLVLLKSDTLCNRLLVGSKRCRLIAAFILLQRHLLLSQLTYQIGEASASTALMIPNLLAMVKKCKLQEFCIWCRQ